MIIFLQSNNNDLDYVQACRSHLKYISLYKAVDRLSSLFYSQTSQWGNIRPAVLIV